MDFTVFDTKKIDEYAKQAKKQWGNTSAYKEYEEKAKKQTKEDQEMIMKNMMLILLRFLQVRGVKRI